MDNDAELLHVHVVAAAMTNGIYEFLMDSGKHLTCGEYELVLDLYRALGEDDEVAALEGPEADHVIHDDEDDMHYHPDDFFPAGTKELTHGI